MRLLLWLLCLPLLILAVAFCVLGIPLSEPAPPAWSGARNGVAAVLCGLVGLAAVAGTGIFVLGRIVRLGQAWDQSLESRGLARVGRRLFACHYAGLLAKRDATVDVSPPFHLQPWRLTVSLRLRSAARIAMGSHEPLLDCRGAAQITLGDDRLDACHLRSDTPTASGLLERQDVRSLLYRIVEDLVETNSWEIYLRPDGLEARIRTYHLTETMILKWLDNLSEFAAVWDQTDE